MNFSHTNVHSLRYNIIGDYPFTNLRFPPRLEYNRIQQNEDLVISYLPFHDKNDKPSPKMYELMKNSQYTSILEVIPVTSADGDKTKELANRFVSLVNFLIVGHASYNTQ